MEVGPLHHGTTSESLRGASVRCRHFRGQVPGSQRAAEVNRIIKKKEMIKNIFFVPPESFGEHQ